jgi:hypothetical protein
MHAAGVEFLTEPELSQDIGAGAAGIETLG